MPARNEADSLPQFFASLERLDRRGLAPILCLHLDSCDDDSAALAQGYVARASMPVWVDRSVQSEPNAGHTRHRAMMLGARALESHGVLLTTDADSRPDTHWLQAMIAALEHADVVAGRVVRSVTQPNPMQDRLERYYEALHATRRLLDPVTGGRRSPTTSERRELGDFGPALPTARRFPLDPSRGGCSTRR